ncbi:hypothetical protein [Defluviimonas sp. SAOS-178_SWC]|uniref:hypothetical protein n=1 Tax=Defluviimonas sp. SAOS-178_SWC TaxID=3121287 RepID=UPI00322147E5
MLHPFGPVIDASPGEGQGENRGDIFVPAALRKRINIALHVQNRYDDATAEKEPIHGA